MTQTNTTGVFGCLLSAHHRSGGASAPTAGLVHPPIGGPVFARGRSISPLRASASLSGVRPCGRGGQTTRRGRTADRDAAGQRQDSRELVGELRRQNEYLRALLDEANTRDREQRRIIAGLTQRIPAIEAP